MENNNKDSSPGISDSWLLIKIKTFESADIESTERKPTENEMEEDSDGISVISESEMHKNNLNASDNEIERPQSADKVEEDECDERNNESEENQEYLLTPPNTPQQTKQQQDEEEFKIDKVVRYSEAREQEIEESTSSKNNHGAMLLIGLSLIIAILYTNISSLKNELSRTVSIYEQRIIRLEQENQMLKTQLDYLMSSLKKMNTLDDSFDDTIKNVKLPNIHQQQQQEEEIRENEKENKLPITKNVWLGGEQENVVKILDKKFNSLPDYCYYLDENDLFYEYNKENCEKKKQKMEERLKKFHQKKEEKYLKPPANSADDKIWKRDHVDETYNDFMTKTADDLLQSLNEEIQEIKNKRIISPTNENDNEFVGKNTDKKAKEKLKENNDKNNFEERPIKKKKNKKNKSKTVTGEWVDKRSSGREEARKIKDIETQEENWFLKRKNDREIYRLDKEIIE